MNKNDNLLYNLLESGKIKGTKELDIDGILVCTAIEDGDYNEINKFWRFEANKSYPRNIDCMHCNRQVMMSNGLFKMFEKNNRKNKVVCGKCVFKFNKEI